MRLVPRFFVIVFLGSFPLSAFAQGALRGVEEGIVAGSKVAELSAKVQRNMLKTQSMLGSYMPLYSPGGFMGTYAVEVAKPVYQMPSMQTFEIPELQLLPTAQHRKLYQPPSAEVVEIPELQLLPSAQHRKLYQTTSTQVFETQPAALLASPKVVTPTRQAEYIDPATISGTPFARGITPSPLSNAIAASQKPLPQSVVLGEDAIRLYFPSTQALEKVFVESTDVIQETGLSDEDVRGLVNFVIRATDDEIFVLTNTGKVRTGTTFYKGGTFPYWEAFEKNLKSAGVNPRFDTYETLLEKSLELKCFILLREAEYYTASFKDIPRYITNQTLSYYIGQALKETETTIINPKLKESLASYYDAAGAEDTAQQVWQEMHEFIRVNGRRPNLMKNGYRQDLYGKTLAERYEGNLAQRMTRYSEKQTANQHPKYFTLVEKNPEELLKLAQQFVYKNGFYPRLLSEKDMRIVATQDGSLINYTRYEAALRLQIENAVASRQAQAPGFESLRAYHENFIYRDTEFSQDFIDELRSVLRTQDEAVINSVIPGKYPTEYTMADNRVVELHRKLLQVSRRGMLNSLRKALDKENLGISYVWGTPTFRIFKTSF